MEIIEKLKVKLPRVKAMYRQINCGGCGFFAAILYSELKRLGYKPEISVFMYSYGDGDVNQFVKNGRFIESLASMNMQSVFLMHVMVKVNGYYLDAEGVHKIGWNYPEVNISYESLKSMLRKSERHCWNRAFNWEQAKPITMTLKEIIKESLK